MDSETSAPKRQSSGPLITDIGSYINGHTPHFIPNFMDLAQFGSNLRDASSNIKPFLTETKNFTSNPKALYDETIETSVTPKNTDRVTDTIFMAPNHEVKMSVYVFEGTVNGNPIDFIEPDLSRGHFKRHPPHGMPLLGHNPFSHPVLTTGSDDEGEVTVNRNPSASQQVWEMKDYLATSDKWSEGRDRTCPRLLWLHL